MIKNMRRHRRRRRSNPFEHGQLQDAIRLVEKITENAKKVSGKRHNPWKPEWDQSLLPEYEEDENNPVYTALNIVSASLSPKVSRKLLQVLMEDANRPADESYKDLFAAVEEETSDIYSLGEPTPPSWIAETRRGKKTFSPLSRASDDFGLDYDQVVSDFDIGSKRRKRLRRRKNRRSYR
jgi:hypothetical protein